VGWEGACIQHLWGVEVPILSGVPWVKLGILGGITRFKVRRGQGPAMHMSWESEGAHHHHYTLFQQVPCAYSNNST
jgi:hypothetical protein